MFKFLKPAKPGASKTKPAAKPKPETAASRPAPVVRPPQLKSAPSPALTPQAADLRYKQQPVMTPEREALIQQALSVHRTQQEVFAELDDEARQKLVLMAMLSLLKEARGEK